MRRADYFPVRPWDLAAQTLVHSATQVKALLIIFAVPEIIHSLIYLVRDGSVHARWVPWWLLSNWIMIAIGSFISAIVFTGIIRYLVLAEGPFWLPPFRWIRSYLATAVVLVPVAMIIGYITSPDLLIAFYRAFVAETYYDESGFLETQAIFAIVAFLISAVLMAVIYPVLGLTAVGAPVAMARILRWQRKYFGRFLFLTLLLMSACLIVQRLYAWLFAFLMMQVTGIGLIVSQSLNMVINQLAFMPLYFLFDIIPAVAIGLLYRTLKANSADL